MFFNKIPWNLLLIDAKERRSCEDWRKNPMYKINSDGIDVKLFIILNTNNNKWFFFLLVYLWLWLLYCALEASRNERVVVELACCFWLSCFSVWPDNIVCSSTKKTLHVEHVPKGNKWRMRRTTSEGTNIDGDGDEDVALLLIRSFVSPTISLIIDNALVNPLY